MLVAGRVSSIDLFWFNLIWYRMLAGIAAWNDILRETSGISLDGSFTKKDVFTLISLGILHLFLPWGPDIAIVSVTGMIHNVHPGSFRQSINASKRINSTNCCWICWVSLPFAVVRLSFLFFCKRTIIYPATNCPNVFFGFPFGEVFGREYSTAQRPSLGCPQTTLWQTHVGWNNPRQTHWFLAIKKELVISPHPMEVPGFLGPPCRNYINMGSKFNLPYFLPNQHLRAFFEYLRYECCGHVGFEWCARSSSSCECHYLESFLIFDESKGGIRVIERSRELRVVKRGLYMTFVEHPCKVWLIYRDPPGRLVTT